MDRQPGQNDETSLRKRASLALSQSSPIILDGGSWQVDHIVHPMHDIGSHGLQEDD